ncbi:MAG: ABC transporter permease subunit [Bacillota bacterium]
MLLKIFPYNKTLFWKDWKLTRLLFYLAAFLIFWDLPMNYFRLLNQIELEGLNNLWFERMLLSPLLLGTGSQIFLIIVLPVAAAALLIGEERRRKTLEFLKVSPYTIHEIFFNKILVGLTVILAPYLINGLIMIVMRLAIADLAAGYQVMHVLNWFWMTMTLVIAFFSFSFLIGMVAGTTTVQVVLTGIFMIFPLGFLFLIESNIIILSHYLGFDGYFSILRHMENIAEYLVLPAYIDSYAFGRMNMINQGLILLSASLGMIAFSKILFDKNQMERNGEVLMFKQLETFFKAGVAFCTMLLMGMMFARVFTVLGQSTALELVIGYIVGLGLGWFIPNYLIKVRRARV